ncbi:MAG: diaminopimelate epimerase [Oscillospiraceae bacterium]|nr:diaminopimelate epimerase [Oscillospiraceae bacterium]
MKFVKMEGCGNDYVYVNGFEEKIENKVEVVKFLSDRHFGIGSDGVIFINPSSIADFEMEMWNADGTRAEMCGNGIRCVAKYVYDFGLTDKTEFTIESFGKIKVITCTLKEGKVELVRVDMGEPILQAELVPIASGNDRVLDEALEVEGNIYHITGVSMGNPHAVTFLDDRFPLADADIETLDLEAIGPKFEHHERFPKRINAEFVKVLDRSHVRMRVWERGTGETLCCGTGCCATAVACILNGLTDNQVTVQVTGGAVHIEWDRESNHIFMTGPARVSFMGEIELP